MFNIADAEDAFLSGHAEFEEWHAEFIRQWSMPLAETILSALAKSLPPEVHQALQEMTPEAYAEFVKMIGGYDARLPETT